MAFYAEVVENEDAMNVMHVLVELMDHLKVRAVGVANFEVKYAPHTTSGVDISEFAFTGHGSSVGAVTDTPPAPVFSVGAQPECTS